MTRKSQLLQKIKCGIGCQGIKSDGSVCGYNENGYALDFAHVNNADKHPAAWKFRSGAGMNNLYTRLCIIDQDKNRMYIKELFQEIRKCEIKCKICHVIETVKNREFQRNQEIVKKRKYVSWIGTSGDLGEKVERSDIKEEEQSTSKLEAYFK